MKDKPEIPEWLPKLAIIFFINCAVAGTAIAGFEFYYKNKAYPGMAVGDISIGGKSFPDIETLIAERINHINDNGVAFSYRGQTSIIYPVAKTLNADAAHEIISFDSDSVMTEIKNYGRDKNFLIAFKDQIISFIFEKMITVPVKVNEKEAENILKDGLGKMEKAPLDSQLTYTEKTNGDKNDKKYFTLTEDQPGTAIKYNPGIKLMKLGLEQLKTAPIELASIKGDADIKAGESYDAMKAANFLLDIFPLTLKYDNQSWPIKRDDTAGWFRLAKNADGKITIDLNEDKISQYLKNKIAPLVDEPLRNAKFAIKDGGVAQFQAANDGKELAIASTTAAIKKTLLEDNKNIVELAMQTTESTVSAAEVNNLGIDEIIGTGKSNFSGSPKNRRHNIKVGAAAVNGSLIKPGEEFSLLKVLGKVDAASGYLEELVIKDNKTTPEFGGGLCQIGTTAFRGALASGLPITLRRNHSYRVSYYEPAGTDATIYDPWPDFRFLNDTEHYILIQTRIDGNNLYFDFWGTKDGRKADIAKPTIYNIIKPPDTKLVETLELKPGEKKCTEHAHNGADAFFDYKVTYPGGEIKEKRFSSHYVPWQEVCLIGVKELSNSASSTPLINNPSAPASTSSPAISDQIKNSTSTATN